jgi:hypothetical protein
MYFYEIILNHFVLNFLILGRFAKYYLPGSNQLWTLNQKE